MNQKINKLKKILLIFLLLNILNFLFSCSNTPESIVKKYFKYLKEEKYEKIEKELLYGKSKEKFVEYLNSIIKDQEYYNEFVKYNKGVKGFKFLEYQEYPEDEIAIKFIILGENGKNIETVWWRLKKINNKYYIIKFSKN